MKNEFQNAYAAIKRPGADKLFQWLEFSDFFTAPASTRFHLSEEGGLCTHSVHVWQRLRALYLAEKRRTVSEYQLSEDEEESIAIIGLLHDLCKVNFYSVEMRNKKIDGRWEQVPFYIVDDKLPYGHGEKSCLIISHFMTLKLEENMAIRWHMGFTDNDFRAGGQSLNKAFEMFPMAVLAHMADLLATYLDESNSSL